MRLKIDIFYRALIQSTLLLWCLHKELIQSSLIWRFHNPYSFRACPRLSNEGWIFWIRFCNDLREAPCANARGPLYSQIWHHSKVFPFSFAAVKHLLKEKITERMETLKWPLLRIDLPCKIPFSFGKNIILSLPGKYIFRRLLSTATFERVLPGTSLMTRGCTGKSNNEGRQNSCFANLSYFQLLEKLSHRL